MANLNVSNTDEGFIDLNPRSLESDNSTSNEQKEAKNDKSIIDVQTDNIDLEMCEREISDIPNFINAIREISMWLHSNEYCKSLEFFLDFLANSFNNLLIFSYSKINTYIRSN